MNITSPSFPNGLKGLKSEADVRALALAKVRAEKAYRAVWGQDTNGFTEDQLVDREFALVTARKAMCETARAFDEAV